MLNRHGDRLSLFVAPVTHWKEMEKIYVFLYTSRTNCFRLYTLSIIFIPLMLFRLPLRMLRQQQPTLD